MAYIFLENCYHVHNGSRAYLRTSGDYFDFTSDVSFASDLDDAQIAKVLQHSDRYKSQYAADTVGVIYQKSNLVKWLKEELKEKYELLTSLGCYIVSVHWYALGIMNHRFVVAFNRQEAESIADAYNDTYSRKYDFPHAVYINTEVAHEEW